MLDNLAGRCIDDFLRLKPHVLDTEITHSGSDGRKAEAGGVAEELHMALSGKDCEAIADRVLAAQSPLFSKASANCVLV